jgi:hypothetical protein
MKGINVAADSEDPSEAADLEDLLKSQEQIQAKLCRVFGAALKLIKQDRESVEPNASEYIMQRFQKLVSMSNKTEEKTKVFVQEVYWACKDVLNCNKVTAMVQQELQLVSAVYPEGYAKSKEEAAANKQQMLEVFQRYLEFETKLTEANKKAEAAAIRAIQYFEKE